MQATRWCFTLNNYTDGEEGIISEVLDSEHVRYGIYGKETGENGTPHLQGFVIFKSNKRFNAVKNLLSQRAHLEVARGKSQQAADYCKKEGDYNEYGDLPGNQGKRNDFEKFKDWVEACDSIPSEYDVASNFPSLYGRYRANAMHMVRLLAKQPAIVSGQFRQWQHTLRQRLDAEPDDRSIEFIVDELGGKGKSWFCKYYISHNNDNTQYLSIGKRDDIAYNIDTRKSIFLFDIPRGGMEYLQYTILESIKDQMIFSPKYESCTKIIPHKTHVVVFCNEEPDRTKMSHDRYKVTHLRSLPNTSN